MKKGLRTNVDSPGVYKPLRYLQDDDMFFSSPTFSEYFSSWRVRENGSFWVNHSFDLFKVRNGNNPQVI